MGGLEVSGACSKVKTLGVQSSRFSGLGVVGFGVFNSWLRVAGLRVSELGVHVLG